MTEDEIIKKNTKYVERLFMQRAPGWSDGIEDVWRLGLVNGASMVLSGLIVVPPSPCPYFSYKQNAALLDLLQKHYLLKKH